MCNCHSYNWDSKEELGTTKAPPLILRPPKEFGFEKTQVEIDRCISMVILHLWRNGVVTYASCCGHGKQVPSIILKEMCSPRYARMVAKMIKEVDNRPFELLSWKLINMTRRI